ncbi:MAG: DoxX family protein [Rhodothermales bacterium]|nr:DoxX family protein [Rhodothermales bacterium]
MSGYQKLLQWQWQHNSLGADLVRVFLGLALLIRGLLFAINPDSLADLAPDQVVDWVAYYIMIAHLVGGALLTVGLFTRVAALIQIPVLVGAVLVVHIRQGLASPNQSLELAALVLFLLIVFFVFGPGKRSLDYRFFGSTPEEQ